MLISSGRTKHRNGPSVNSTVCNVFKSTRYSFLYSLIMPHEYWRSNLLLDGFAVQDTTIFVAGCGIFGSTRCIAWRRLSTPILLTINDRDTRGICAQMSVL